MRAREIPVARCVVETCQRRSASHLGVCAVHWGELPRALQRRWQAAWYDDARTEVWAAARRACLDHLNDNTNMEDRWQRRNPTP